MRQGRPTHAQALDCHHQGMAWQGPACFSMLSGGQQRMPHSSAAWHSSLWGYTMHAHHYMHISTSVRGTTSVQKGSKAYMPMHLWRQ